ncbi:MAG: extracellular solute-binding protein [Cytophagales bacterium]|nr:extracellular solute-binding protein [Armatimonadota bacterium]
MPARTRASGNNGRRIQSAKQPGTRSCPDPVRGVQPPEGRIALAGGATPDLMSPVWAEELAGYALRGVLTPLDEYLARSGRSLAEWIPGVARMLTINGKIYGLAVTTNTTLIADNKAVFREVGLDPEKPPRTIAELDEAVRQSTKHRGKGTAKHHV